MHHFISEYAVGFNRTNTSGVEGHSIEVCIETTAGILAPNITVPFLVRAPREDPLLPEGSPSDTAIGILTIEINLFTDDSYI